VRAIGPALAVRGDLAWSPDSQSLIAGIVRDGEPRLARIFLDGTPPQPMASEYSIDPVWSPDRMYLVYSGADVGTTFPLQAFDPDGRPYARPSMTLTRGARRVAFAADERSLVHPARRNGPQGLLAIGSADRGGAPADRSAIKLRDRRFRRFAGRDRNHLRTFAGEFEHRADRAHTLKTRLPASRAVDNSEYL